MTQDSCGRVRLGPVERAVAGVFLTVISAAAIAALALLLNLDREQTRMANEITHLVSKGQLDRDTLNAHDARIRAVEIDVATMRRPWSSP